MTGAATPGVDRVFLFTVRGHAFGYRWPSRAEVSETRAKTFLKLAFTGAFGDTAMAWFDNWDGFTRRWEAQLEVGLMPRVRNTAAIDLGETAPSHWIEEERDSTGKIVNRRISFENVMPDELDEVIASIEAELAKKKTPPSASSGTTVAAPTNA